MRIAVISEWFSEEMGYAENLLSKALAAQGHEVHVITSTAQVYFNSPIYKETYEPFLGPNLVSPGVKRIDGFELHRLPIQRLNGMPGIQGLQEYLEKLMPDVVQTFDVLSTTTYDSALFCNRKGIKLFTASHLHESVFNHSAHTWKRRIRNLMSHNPDRERIRFISKEMIRCFPISADAARIVTRYFGVPEKKVEIQPLGVDTALFHPPGEQDLTGSRSILRKELGLVESDLVCIYTGRFSEEKNPQCLAQAIQFLQDQEEKVFGLFVGRGRDTETEKIKSAKGCFLKNFVPVKELKKFYWTADIGVWPFQESTSQLDAMACGLPLLLSDKIEVLERIQGNGLVYRQGDSVDLAKKILQLKDSKLRMQLSRTGIAKVEQQFSWNAIAANRVNDYISGL